MVLLGIKDYFLPLRPGRTIEYNVKTRTMFSNLWNQIDQKNKSTATKIFRTIIKKDRALPFADSVVF